MARLGSGAIGEAASARVDCVTSVGTSLEKVVSIISVEVNSAMVDLLTVGSAIVGSAIFGSAIIVKAIAGSTTV